MKVLVFEPKFVGHFLGFAIATARAFEEAGGDVTLALSSHARGTPPAEVKLREAPPGVSIQYACDVPKVYQKWTNARLESDALQALLEECDYDWLVVPSADFLVSGLMLRGGLRRRIDRLAGADLVLHNCRQAYPQPALRELPTRWLDRLAVTVASRWRLHTVDDFAVSDAAAGRLGLWGSPVSSLPHFYDRGLGEIDQAAARESLGLEQNAWWIGSAGDLGRRKGTELLIESFAAGDTAKHTRLALFGQMSDSVRATLDKHRSLVDEGRIHVCDRFVSEEEFRRFFPAMDVVWAGYPRQVGIASTLLFAADAGRPVIAIDYGGVGWTVRKYGLGTVCKNDRESIASAIRSATRSPALQPHTDGSAQFLERHSNAGFNTQITQGVRSAQQAQPATGPHARRAV